MPMQRRARDHDGRPVEPMTLANMRENGVRSITATCETCQHEAILGVDHWPGDMPACGGREIATRPNWRNRDKGAGR
jgi:hypothetical protein